MKDKQPLTRLSSEQQTELYGAVLRTHSAQENICYHREQQWTAGKWYCKACKKQIVRGATALNFYEGTK